MSNELREKIAAACGFEKRGRKKIWFSENSNDDMGYMRDVDMTHVVDRLELLLTTETAKAGIEELRKLQNTRWKDLAYDIGHYLKNRIKEIKSHE